MILRHAEERDIPQIIENGKAFTEAAYPAIPYDQASFERCTRQMMACKLLIVAEEEGVHLGGVGAIAGPLFINENILGASERFWWVKPDQRAGGIGKALLSALEVAAKDAGCKYLSMIALHDQHFPLVDGFYKKMGHRPSEHIYMKAL